MIIRHTRPRVILQKRGLSYSVPKLFQIPLLPTRKQKPGGVEGDVNSASFVPSKNNFKGSLHWDLERIISMTLVPLIVLPFITVGTIHTITDTLLGAMLVGHCHIGFQSCIIDYVSKRVYGRIHNYFMYLLTVGTLLSGVGIYKIEVEDGGISTVVKQFWHD
ncbi:hypothetical protein KAFR_0H02020 [Kazachstania africana CBS 2517]|uniref:Succinate dehydrogenase [ubiquinone] cytochrome b small subunit n=1 Tax=Kazachstania africana (strain ATCC 22294 / BCRC 22015 / CBS 2517 / CECT 1963 / NBRC 1671 / NRRL Y-8276) TaxID=1071382 RepID=H2AZ55_KAZAF|nr:hypothetical protein KAFR_0H02020 [Kazachstania africana CBS 2517]CCF59611.1 hypothetical protein KAFR_0H02020 [Kazachstania africana CBS 2517]